MLTRINPYDGSVVSEVASATPAEIGGALQRADTAWRDWARRPVAQRAAVLHRFADLLTRDADRLAHLITVEVGKRLAEAVAEVEWTVRTARWYAEHPPPQTRVEGALVRTVPLGTIAVVTPWNVPLVTPAWKLLPALMVGNAVVWKPSELTTATALEAAALLAESGLPGGVLEVLPGAGDVGTALIGDGRVAGVHFTGSAPVGRRIAAGAGARLQRLALELGGGNPAVVLEDADLPAAAEAVIASMAAINGQKCTATRRVVVHAEAATQLEALLVAGARELVPGDPLSPATALGPLATPAAAAAAEAAVARSVADGARLVARAPAGSGLAAFRPTVLADVSTDDPLRREELFAPVLLLDAVADDAAAIRAANATPFGLAAAVHGRDPERMLALGRELDVGILGFNRRTDAVELEPPFSGRKQSGNGVPEGGAFAYAGVGELQAVYGLPDAVSVVP